MPINGVYHISATISNSLNLISYIQIGSFVDNAYNGAHTRASQDAKQGAMSAIEYVTTSDFIYVWTLAPPSVVNVGSLNDNRIAIALLR